MYMISVYCVYMCT